MKVYQCLIGILGIILMVVHLLWSDIDSTILILYFILAIPVSAQYISKAKIPGAEFEFKEEINKTKELLEISAERASEEIIEKGSTNEYYTTFNVSMPKTWLKSDANLALASLRMEIEKKLRSTIQYMNLDVEDNTSLNKTIRILEKEEILYPEQVSALTKIIEMCNKAVHGYPVTKEEAEQIIDLTEELNSTFAIGYSIEFTPNENYQKQGLICEWEHCIEHMGFSDKEDGVSCPVFGHDCPGGKEKVMKCNKNIHDIQIERFV